MRLCCKRGTIALICTPREKVYKTRIVHDGSVEYVDFIPVYHICALYYYAVVERTYIGHKVTLDDMSMEADESETISLKYKNKCLIQMSADECAAVLCLFGDFYLCKQKNTFPFVLLQTQNLFPSNVMDNKCCFHVLSSLLLDIYLPTLCLEKLVSKLKLLLVEKIFDRYPYPVTETEKSLMAVFQPIVYLLHSDRTIFVCLLVITMVRYAQSQSKDAMSVFSHNIDVLYEEIKVQ